MSSAQAAALSSNASHIRSATSRFSAVSTSAVAPQATGPRAWTFVDLVPEGPNSTRWIRTVATDAARVHVLFITIDPERDTPALLAQYVPAFDPTFLGLRGDAVTTAKTAKDFKVYYQKVPGKSAGSYTMDHTALIYLMDRDGHFVAPFNLKRTPEEAAQDLKRYL